jgi:dTMP kinase
LNDFHYRVTGGLVPTRTYFLDISPEDAVSRRMNRTGQAADRMESGDRAFYERVMAAYRELARQEPHRILILDANQSVDALHGQIWADLARLRVGTRGISDGSSKTS